jgi:hypothetical protein
VETLELGRSRGRALEAWDALGLLATIAVMAVVATWGAVRGTPGYGWIPEALFLLGVGSSLAVVPTSLALARRRLLDTSSIPLRLARVWLDPPHDWLMFVFGFLVALPVLALHTSVLLGDSDSARVVSSTMYVQRNGLGYLAQTQDNLLPYLTLGPLLSLGGIPAAKLFSVLSVQALAGSVSFLTWKMTRSAVAALAGILALMAFPLVWERATLLPMYPLMLAFGFLGLYFAHRATLVLRAERTRAAFFAGVCFVLSFEANRIGQFFLAFTLFLFLTAPWRRVGHGLARVYAFVAVLSIPRVVINLWDGGFNNFFSNRVDYWVTKGYLVQIQENYFHLPINVDLSTYATRLGEHLDRLFTWTGLVVLGLGLAGLVVARGSMRRFALVCIAAFLAAVLYRRVPFYERYFSPLMVAGALGAGVTVHFLLQRSAAFKSAAAVAFVALLVGAGLTYADMLGFVQHKQRNVLAGPIRKLDSEIDDGKGVIGSRSGRLLFVSPNIKTYGGQFLSEQEYVTYLTWPSDRNVIAVMRRHDIGWALTVARRRFETDYQNAWLVPAYGKKVHHLQRLAASPRFCEVLRINEYVLYRLGPCPS